MENRRSFVKRIIGALGVGAVALKSPVAFAEKLALPLNKVAALKKVGGSATVTLSGKEILIIRDTDKTVRGLSAKCTHRDCPMSYNKKTRKIDCSCHGSSFDLNGKVLGGPAKKDLKRYAARLSEGRIIIAVD
jgi:Rieske Fe-S protein